MEWNWILEFPEIQEVYYQKNSGNSIRWIHVVVTEEYSGISKRMYNSAVWFIRSLSNLSVSQSAPRGSDWIRYK